MSILDPTPFPLRAIAAAERNDRLRADLEVTMPELQQLLATSSNEQQEIVGVPGALRPATREHPPRAALTEVDS